MTIANTTIQIRKSGVTGNVPNNLNLGELALNYVDGKLFYKNAGGTTSYFYGANNGPSFSTVVANGSSISTTVPNDILTLNSSNGISITSCTSSKTITFGNGANAYFPSIVTVNYTGTSGSQNAAFVVTGANTKGGVGYVDFLQANNQSLGAANTSKWFRIDNAGTYQIINSAYSTNIFNLTDTGTLSVPNMSSLTLTQSGGGSITFQDGTKQYTANAGGGSSFNGGTITNTLTISNTTPSTSITTGALIVNGGVGVAGNIILSGTNSILAGNVAIGPNSGSPGTQLDVSTPSTYTQTTFRVGNFNASGFTVMRLQNYSANGKYFDFGVSGPSSGNSFYIFDGQSSAYRMFINPTGSVGFGGNTSPVSTLDVNGTFNAYGAATALSFNGSGSGLTGNATSLSIGGSAGSVAANAVTGSFSQVVTVSNKTIASSNTSAALVVSGGQAITGSANGVSGLYVGLNNPTTYPNVAAIFTTNANSYSQINQQNLNLGTQSTADFIATASNGNDLTYYIDMGVTGNNYNNLNPYNSLGTAVFPNDSYLYAQGGISAGPGGNLVIGTATTGSIVNIISGGVNNANIVATFNNAGTPSTSNSTGALVINGGLSTTSNVFAGTSVLTNSLLYANGVPWVMGGASATVTNDTITSSAHYILFTTQTSGSLSIANTSNSGLTFVPATGTLGATIFQSLSDENQKTNIKIIDNAMEITDNLRGVTFDWKENGLPSAGLIAQDVEKYLPQLINTNGENKTLNYNGIIGVLVEAIKDLNQRVKDLESKQ